MNKWRSATWMPHHGSQLDLPGGVFEYSFDLIHFFFSKVNNSEMNSPILLDAHLPGKQDMGSGLVFTATDEAQTNACSAGHGSPVGMGGPGEQTRVELV